MGSLISTLLNKIFSDPLHKVLLLGLNNVGKTSILYRLSLNKFIKNPTPTIGSNVETIFHKFKIWDIGGQESQRELWSLYFGGDKVVGIIFVVDSSTDNMEDYIVSKMELQNLINSAPSCEGVPILIFNNKVDLESHLTSAEVSIELELNRLRRNPWHIQDCSALSGEGIYEGMEWLADQIKEYV